MLNLTLSEISQYKKLPFQTSPLLNNSQARHVNAQREMLASLSIDYAWAIGYVNYEFPENNYGIVQ
jgi:hypothetical protein